MMGRIPRNRLGNLATSIKVLEASKIFGIQRTLGFSDTKDNLIKENLVALEGNDVGNKVVRVQVYVNQSLLQPLM